MKNVFRSRLLASTLLIGGAALAQPALAQSTSKPADDPASARASQDGQTTGEVVVTGSRIARPDLEAASPVTTVSQEQIALTGTVTLENLLNELPQVIPGNTRVSNNSGGQSFATLDLRGLGPGRTLILLNGERLPPSSTNGVTDISQIPVQLIQRVDVVTGGASAVYGSDAIAGVINFILRDDYQGLELTTQASVAERGMGFNFSASGILGGNFADGKGNITLFASYYDRDAVSQSRFGYSRIAPTVYFDPTARVDANNRAVRTGFPVVVQNVSQVPAGYVVGQTQGSTTAPWPGINALAGNPFRGLAAALPATFAAADTDCNPATAGVPVNSGQVSFNAAGQLAPFFTSGFGSTGLCAVPQRSTGSSVFNFAPQNYLVIPQDRTTFSALGKYELGENTMFRFYGSFTNSNNQVNLAATPATNIVVPSTAVGIPADLRTALNTRVNPAGDFQVNRRFIETGPRDGRFKTESFNLRGIVDHDFGGNWKGSFIGSFGRVDNTQRGIGNINNEAVAQGVRGCVNSAGVVNGPGVLPGCVPVNIFTTLTPAMVNFVRIDTQQQARFEQVRGAANLVGTLFDLPAGPVGVALGAEYRKDTGESIVDDEQRRGNIYGFNAVQSLAGSINVKEVYGEIRAPILSRGDGGELLAIGAGGRYSDYSTVGGLFNWKVEAEFAPIRQLRLRGTYNKAARAPNVFELFRNGDQGFGAFTDPCQLAPGATRTAALAVTCQSATPYGGLAPGVAFSQANSQVEQFAFGSPSLQEERAETFTAGAVINAGRIFGGSLNITADYYNIKLRNRVAALGAAFFLGQCYNANDAVACARIRRNPGTGQILSIDTSVTNSANPLETAGVDVGFDWSIPFNVFGDARLTFSDTMTYVDRYNIITAATATTPRVVSRFADTIAGGIGGSSPRWANTATVAYRTDRFTGQVRYVYAEGPRQNYAGAGFGTLFPDSVTARVPSLNLVNMSLRYQVSDHFELTGVVNNLLDKLPPLTVTGLSEQAGTNISFYDPYALGRNYTVQARVRF